MKKLIWMVLPALLVLASCSSTKVTESWSDNAAKPAMKKILVLGLFNDRDRNLRIQMERQLVNDLKAYGYEAVSSYDAYGPKSFGSMDEQKALQKLKDNSIEGVVTIALLDRSRERRFVPGGLGYPYGPGFWGYYSYYSPRIYQPGYYETNTNYYFETNLYNTGDSNKLLYSAQSKSLDPSSVRALADQYARTIVKDMRKKSVLSEG